MADELIRADVDVLVAWGPGVEVVARKTTRIPIVMGASAVHGPGPRIDSLARPGHNVTGMTLIAGPEINGKRLALLKQLLPSLKRVAFVSQSRAEFGDLTLAAARQLDLELVSFFYDTERDIPTLYEAMAKRSVGAAVIAEDPIANLEWMQQVVHREARRRRLPTLFMSLTGVETGGLIAHGQDIRRLYDRTAYFIDRILRGTKAGDIPIEQPARFELWINQGAARAIGLSIPAPFLLQADRVLE